MKPLKETHYYKDVVKEFNYPFADIYAFDGFVISEIKEGINFTWEEHAQVIIDDIVGYFDTNGNDIIYISHRIHSYSVMASDWVKFFKHSYSLKNYGVIGYNNTSFLNSMIENLFFKNKIKSFTDLDIAMDWATNIALEKSNSY